MSHSNQPPASSTKDAAAGSVQAAFRDVTNNYLMANKENIPPADFRGRGFGHHGGKGRGRKAIAPACPPSVGSGDSSTVCCGTPTETCLSPMSKRAAADSAVAASLRVGDAHGEGDELQEQHHRVASEVAYARLAASALTPATPNRPQAVTAAAAACDPGASVLSDSNSLVSAGRTPGHNAAAYPPSAAAATSTAAKLQQQRQRSLCLAQSGDHGLASPSTAPVPATPGPVRPRGGRMTCNPFTSSPLHQQAKAGSNVSSPTGEAAAPATAQAALHCTPSGARRSAAVAAARVLSETPSRIDDITFLLNNSFESGSESPTRDGAIVTPNGSYDLQRAVEEMLRGCLDNSTPAKRSDSSGATPHGSRKGQQHPLDTAAPTATSTPFNPYAALDAYFAAPSLGRPANAGQSWGQGFDGGIDATPDRFAPPRGVFAESDNDDAGNSPQSEGGSRAPPSAGVRRDPMVYFSTAAVSTATTTAHVDPQMAVALFPDDAATAAMMRMGGGGEDMLMAAESDGLFHRRRSSEQHSGAIAFHNDGASSGPDMLAMLAAAVQQQRTPRSTTNSTAELESQTISDCDADASLPPPPPSYGDGHPPHRQPSQGRHGRHESVAAASAAASQPLPPPRRSHHLPQVKAAAGSLIAVSGRRVPVDKLHLLALSSGEEGSHSSNISPTAGDTTRHSSRSGAGRQLSQSPPAQQHHHVEGPSMRRVPTAAVVTVTRAPPPLNAQATMAGGASRMGRAGHNAAVLPSPSSHSSLSDAAAARTTTRVVVPGPSARRVPPPAHTNGLLGATRPVSAAAGVDAAGARQSSEGDVVAVLQFSKGQTMRFLTNLSPAALTAATAALREDVEAGTSAASLQRLCDAPLRTVEVGKSYLAHVYGDQSPYENVAFEDVGVCVRFYTAATACEQAFRDHVDGVLLREVDVVTCEEDRAQHELSLQHQTAAYIECERQFKFSSLPFQLESIYFSFDGRVCLVLYRVVANESVPASSSPLRYANTSRVVRELQFHLNCRVFLKQC